MRIINGENIEFQKYDVILAQRLIDVIQRKEDFILIAFPDVFNGMKKYKNQAIYIWKKHLSKYMVDWILFSKGQKKFNAFLTRPYIIYKDTSGIKNTFCLIQKIWEQRDIVFIEGISSRLGVGNDLFSNAKSIVRILCPAENAFDKYDEIFNTAKEMPVSSLMLIALGPTATILSFDLSEVGYQAIDVGHIDIEYEWLLMKANWAVKVENKFVNEAIEGNTVSDFKNSIYESEIFKIIS